MEIESFLSDLDHCAKSTDTVEEIEKENLNEQNKATTDSMSEDLRYLDCMSLTRDPPNAPEQKLDNLTEEELIRKFCSATFEGVNMHDAFTLNLNEVVDIGRIMLSRCQYRLVPHRFTHTDKYEHPVGSKEANKALLISLQPQIAEAERQRKNEEELCIKFTKCNAVKSKSGRKSYEYIEMNAKKALPYKEFEER